MAQDGADPTGIEVVGVVGGGTIGASWTALFLAAGLEVDVHDPSDGVEAYVRDYVERAWPSLAELGLADNGDPDRVRFARDPGSAVARAQFVQESVPERIGVKREVFSLIEPRLTPGAVVATSSSGLLLGDLQQGWRDPGRLVLGHPFNPPHLIPLVELLANDKTAAGTLEKAERFYGSVGKVTIRVRKEVPAHVANRLQAALWREAIHLVVEGVASVEDVDKAVSAGPGLRWAVMGPHMLFNLGSGGHGMEVFCERFGPSFHRWWEDLGDPRLTPEVVARLCEGIREEEKGRAFDELSAERDAKIVAALKAMRAAVAEGRKEPRLKTAR